MDIPGLTNHLERRGTNSVKWDTCGPDELPLWVADMDFAPPACVREAILKRLEHPALGYTFAPRSWEEAVRSWCSSRQGWTPGGLVPLQGVMAGLHGSILVSTKPGDSVLIQPPVYHPFASIPPRLNRRVAESPLRVRTGDSVAVDGERPVHMEWDWESLEAEFSDPAVTAMILCSPHNPGGLIWSRTDLVRLGELARRHAVTLIVDEIHADIVREEGTFLSMGALVAEKAWGEAVPDIIVIQAPTKAFNMAGISSAWACASTPELLHRLDLCIRNLGTEVINVLSFAAAEAVYVHGYPWLQEIRALVDRNLDWLHHQVRLRNMNRMARNAGGQGASCTDREQDATALPGTLAASLPQATYLYWLHTADSCGPDSRALVQDLRTAGLRLNPGAQFGTGGEGFVRINVATHPDNLARAWHILNSRLG